MAELTVWVVETGVYEESAIDAIYNSLEAAISGTKSNYGHPYIVTWELEGEEGLNILVGHFKDVPGYSIEHKAKFYITSYPVKEAINGS